MDNVTALNPSRDLSEFFEFVYGDQTGFVYSPVKHPETEEWTRAFFQWPAEKAELVAHVVGHTKQYEVYFGPALYSAPNATKEYAKGSYLVWVDFDGNAPESYMELEFPPPSMQIMSSEKGHEHVYWKLDYFEVDSDVIENANRSLAYSLKADTSGWDVTQVLRPPGTWNHKRNRPVATYKSWSGTISIDSFEKLPEVHYVVQTIDISKVPDPLNVIAKYQWDSEAFEFFRKKDIPVGSRSSAMMRLGYYCAEMGMSDEEAYSILDNADQRWKKFIKRSDRTRRLLDIINRARIKFPLNPEHESVDEFPIFHYKDLLDSEINVEWILPGFLQRGGSVLLAGPAGTGKSQLTLQFAIHMALGKNFLGWEITKQYKMVFFSLEMGHAELKYFLTLMNEVLTEEEQETLNQNFILIPMGEALLLTNPGEQARIQRFVNEYRPDGIVFDSLSVTTEDELASETATKAIFMFVNRLRNQHDLFVWFIHHNRKAQTNNKKPNKLSDVFGSYIVTSQPTAIVNLWPTTRGIEVTGLKIRLAPPFAFRIQRTEHLTFNKIEKSDLSQDDVDSLVPNLGGGDENDDDNTSGETNSRFSL